MKHYTAWLLSVLFVFLATSIDCKTIMDPESLSFEVKIDEVRSDINRTHSILDRTNSKIEETNWKLDQTNSEIIETKLELDHANWNIEEMKIDLQKIMVALNLHRRQHDQCLSSPCLHGGTCVDSWKDYACHCAPGYAGTRCENDIDECTSDPCLNGGACTDQFNGYSCGCLPGFTGDRCDIGIDECTSVPCLNGGTCRDRIDGYICECLRGFTGSSCETDIDDCASSPCQNGGACVDLLNSYTCHCSHGFTGSHCETDFDECASSPCQNGGTCVDLVNSYTCQCSNGVTGMLCETVRYRDCEELLQAGYTTNGVYTINLGGSSKSIYCDQITDGGGWIVFQRRLDTSTSFYRDWTEYKNGFGNLTGNLWLGNDNLHRLTQGETKTLRIDLWYEEKHVFATYQDFAVDDESNKYQIHIGSYIGTAWNQFMSHNNMNFTTKEADNDRWTRGNCAQSYKGGWWFDDCQTVTLNGIYGLRSGQGIKWNSPIGLYPSRTEMKFRTTV